ncbi:hypothetical protein C8F04DRAFT_1258259 [Mycena alexandri]|uniref:Uncharacterized protein n=1 Tax=Mycena alexandri TaxID=1745969 RepID=A0AAD6SZX1_9AGAR|nr:hypothetical protein C8F04DRAFT_1258259 [Mycena alexandri]
MRATATAMEMATAMLVTAGWTSDTDTTQNFFTTGFLDRGSTGSSNTRVSGSSEVAGRYEYHSNHQDGVCRCVQLRIAGSALLLGVQTPGQLSLLQHEAPNRRFGSGNAGDSLSSDSAIITLGTASLQDVP